MEIWWIGDEFITVLRIQNGQKIRIRDSDPGLTTRIILRELKKPFFGLNYLNSLMRIRDPGWKKFGSVIRDKHPGSATLIY
jgi:hypothetical protein